MSFFENTRAPFTRRGYWTGIGAIMLVLVIAAAFSGCYTAFEHPPEGPDGETITSNDPFLALLYTPIGMALALLVSQFVIANVLLYAGAGVYVLFKRKR